ncbi:hypothetical protein [Pantanalinema sp. GBBB05]|uniref:hypothetical protein n=1 Tax=Pantanalinema sp. GBBB05 TaxID=2604139 RepID=UPI001D9FC47F|nr:hypothetical protein [Pantanalinema sp. GBBB05]
MGTRANDLAKSVSDLTAAVPQTTLQPRPFAQPTAEPKPTLEAIQAQLEHAQQFGHHLANFAASQPEPPPSTIQPKLTIGAPEDKYEQEADRVAQQVVQQIKVPQLERPQPGRVVPQESSLKSHDLHLKPMVQREELSKEDENLQAKPDILQWEKPPDAENLKPPVESILIGDRSHSTDLQMKPLPPTRQQEAIDHEPLLESQQQQAVVPINQSGSSSRVQRQLEPIGGKSSGWFRRGKRDTLNELTTKYNATDVAKDNFEVKENAGSHDKAQEGMNNLYKIQQTATTWLETIKNGKLTEQRKQKIDEIEKWYYQKFISEYDRVNQILLQTASDPKSLPKVPKKTLDIFAAHEVESKESRDKRANSVSGSGANVKVQWEVVKSNEYVITKDTPAYRVANTDDPKKITSYDPRSARSLRSKDKTPNTSEIMSYGHVYFAFDKKIANLYSQYLADDRIKAMGTYTLKPGYTFKRDPEIPEGFRSSTKLPEPDSVQVIS